MKGRSSAKETILQNCTPELEVPFSLAEYRERLERVRAIMAREKVDLLYLSSPESMAYLSGYQAGWTQAQSPRGWPPLSGLAVHVDHGRFILFDTKEECVWTRSTTVSTDTRLFPEIDLAVMLNTIAEELRAAGWLGQTAGLEMWSYRPNRAVSEALQSALERIGFRVVDGTDIVREARAVKSPQEMAYTATAGRIADVGMLAAIEAIRPGVCELDVYGEIVHAMAGAGGENPGIPVAVLSGPKTACPHGLASRRRLMPGDIVTVDLCGVYHRYHANLARTFSVGQPHPEVAKVVTLSANAFDLLADIIRPSMRVVELNEQMRAYYQEVGLWSDRMWVGGYELGIAFPPDWVGTLVYDPDRDPGRQLFVPGTVVNYEGNFYLPASAGASLLIDTIVFAPERARVLSRIPHELIVIA